MRILEIRMSGKQKNPYGSSEHLYDLEATSGKIIEGIKSKFNDIEITSVKELALGESYHNAISQTDFDLCICDMTTYNSNISYLAGLIEGMGKPIIYYATNDHSELPVITHKKTMFYSDASLESDFRIALNDEIETIIKSPKAYSAEIILKKNKPKAFISYSHADREYLDRLMVHLKPLEKEGLLDIWEDSKIKTGDYWENEIDTALAEANIAILLISADFLASDFIVNNELPPLLAKAEVKGTRVVPVILSHCRFSRDQLLNRFQAVNSPNEPLSIMDYNAREAIYDKLSLDIESALKEP
jgi:hypothetical protein